MRSSVHRTLSRALGQRWFETSPLLRPNELRRANEAAMGLRERRADPTPVESSLN